jgi:hypothetical protein
MPEGRREVEDWLAGRGAVVVAALVAALVVMALVRLL